MVMSTLERKFLVACAVLVLMTTVSLTVGASEHQTGGDDEMDSSENKEANKSIEKVDSTLIRLMDASDKEEFAERNGLSYSEGRVKVIVEMEDGATMPRNYNTTKETNYTGQGENLAQAYVQIDNIRSLSNEKGVRYVRPPLSSASLQENGRNEAGDEEGPETDESEYSESSETQDTQGTDKSETQGMEGLSSVMGSILATLIIVLTAAYARRDS